MMAALLPCAGVRPLAAQATAVVRGEVVEQPSGTPVSAARVLVDGETKATADTAGRFIVAGLAPGEHRVRVERLGYTPFDVLAAVGDTLRLTVVLHAEPRPLSPVDVTAPVPAPAFDPLPAEFEDRRSRSRGSARFLARAEIGRMMRGSLVALLRRMPGARIVHDSGSAGDYLATSGSPGPYALLPGPRPSACYAQVILNGVQLFVMGRGEPPNLNQFSLTELLALEYYAHGSSTPSEIRAMNIDCGTLVLWTRVR